MATRAATLGRPRVAAPTLAPAFRPPTQPKLGAGLIGPWDRPPKLDPEKFTVGKVGSGPFKGKYVARRKPAAAAAPDPFAGHPDAELLRKYADQPWAQTIIRTLRDQQTHHEGYVTDKVMPWASGALTGLANINKAAQDQFTGAQEAIGQGLAQAGGAQPGMVQGVSGGAVSGANAYLGAASAQAMAARGSTMAEIARYQGLMGTLGPTTYSQGQIAALSDYAKGLPALYAQKRQEAIDRIDQYIAERELEEAKVALEQARFEETQRSNRVNEAIRATNAETNAAIQFGRLGIDAAGEARRGAPGEPPPPDSEIPYGFVRVPTADGGWEIRRDPRVPAATESGSGGGGSTAPSAARGEYEPNNLARNGFVGGWKTRPSAAAMKRMRTQGRATGGLVQATDGTWWIKSSKPPARSSGSTGAAGRAPRDVGTLAGELRERYHGNSDPFGSSKPGWVDIFNRDTAKVTQAVLSWVLNNRRSFTDANGVLNVRALTSVLDTLGGPQGRNTTARVMREIRKRIDARGRLR